MPDNELTPAQKRHNTMVAKYGEDYAKRIGSKTSKTMREKFTPEQRSEMASRAGKIGGRNSPNKFKVGDERAVRAGRASRPYSRKPRPDDVSDSSE